MIRAENLYRKFRRFEALRGLNMSVSEGSAYALIGANGAGKTTIMRTVMNIYRPTSGTVTVMGVDSRRLSPRELAAIGHVSESRNLPSRLTGADYLDFLRPFYPTWDRNLESELIAQLDLPLDRPIGSLSHGMRMKLCLLCALPYRPKLLVLDEPFSGLDPLIREELMEGVLGQAGETTIFISTHELSEIESMATHVAFIDDGRILFEESMSALNGRFREVRITLDREAAAPASAPAGWLGLKAAGPELTFVESQFSDDLFRSRLGSLFDNIRRIEAEPMPLRSIFTVLARSARESRKA